MYKIAVMGDYDSIYGFAAVGLDTYPLSDEKEAEKRKTKRKAVRRNKQRTALNMQKYET